MCQMRTLSSNDDLRRLHRISRPHALRRSSVRVQLRSVKLL
uniref:Uncharacterized protein n=1 Tax=Arundo donax TaxID=35708 RepID=A0A0A9DI68_ARUDO